MVDEPVNLEQERRRRRRRRPVAGSIVWPELNQYGQPVARSRANIRVFFEHEQITVRYDRFAMQASVTWGDAPLALLSDEQATDIWLRADDLGLKSAEAYFVSAVESIARESSFHPVLEYLDALPSWDGKPRLDRFIVTHFGAVDTQLNCTYGRKMLIASVSRVRQPGVKFDVVGVLQGAQGKGKSSGIAALCPNPEWFTDSVLLGDDQKQVIEKTLGKWLCEIAEMDGMSKRDVGTSKAMLSRQADRSRLAYGRMTVERRRQFTLWGSVNEHTYLRDMTGNRRFWTIALTNALPFNEIVAGIVRDRDQLWAEAAHAEAAGESLNLSEELYAASVEDQATRVVVDPWMDLLAPELTGKIGLVEKARVWERLGVKVENQAPQLGARLNQIMAALGFTDPNGIRRKDTRPAVRCFIHSDLAGGKPGKWLSDLWKTIDSEPKNGATGATGSQRAPVAE